LNPKEVLRPQTRSVNQNQEPTQKHKDTNLVDAVHHTQIKILGLMSTTGLEDFHEIPKE